MEFLVLVHWCMEARFEQDFAHILQARFEHDFAHILQARFEHDFAHTLALQIYTEPLYNNTLYDKTSVSPNA